MTTLRLIKSIGRSPSRLALLLIPLVFACFALPQRTQGVVPPPDGGYPGFTTAEGTNALQSLTNGAANTAVGWSSLLSNAEGSFNTATGAGALLFNTANENAAFGAAALLLNTTGSNNTAVGAVALLNNTEGIGNTATGNSALYSNTTGNRNTANGWDALYSNTTGSFNTANGYQALYSNTTGNNNTVNGLQTLYSNTTGSYNIANGNFALYSNTTGSFNAANGRQALNHNTTGDNNTANGFAAFFNNTTGFLNTALGAGAGNDVITANNVICIGAGVTGADVSNTTWIGGVYGVTTQSGTAAAVMVSDTGQLGTLASSERFKKDISTMETASEAILSLRPVTFHYRTDTKGTSQFGLIAEEVAKVNPALVLPDKDGKPYTVRYDAVNAMLLNEFLKEHLQVRDLKGIVAGQQKQIDALTAGLQKVNAQLEASKPAPQVVNNP